MDRSFFEDLNLSPSLKAHLDFAAEVKMDELKGRMGLPETATGMDVFREALARAKAATTTKAHDNDNCPRP